MNQPHPFRGQLTPCRHSSNKQENWSAMPAKKKKKGKKEGKKKGKEGEDKGKADGQKPFEVPGASEKEVALRNE